MLNGLETRKLGSKVFCADGAEGKGITLRKFKQSLEQHKFEEQYYVGCEGGRESP